MPIGVFDSGLGGLTILSRLRAALPDQAFVYLGDTAHAPYGARDGGEIFDLTRAATAALFERGCSLVILACNTASAVALRQMQEFWVPADRRVLGVFVPMIEEILRRPWGPAAPTVHRPARRVLLFATPATVESGAFTRELCLRATGVRILEVPCPGLVDALEAGDSAAADSIVAKATGWALAGMPRPEVAALGCTHYPLAAGAFARALPSDTRILAQGDLVADSLKTYLARHPAFVDRGETIYLTSGDPEAVSNAAEAFLGERPPFQPL